MKTTGTKITMMLLLTLLLASGIYSCKNKSLSKTGQDRTASENYLNFCAGCHGDNLEKFAAGKWMEEKGTTSIEKSIKEGITAMGMPAFANTFNNDELKALARYVKNGIPADRTQLKPALTADGIVTSELHDFVIDTVVTGLEVPWGLAFLPDGRLLISERSGTLHTFANGVLSAPIGGLPPIMAGGQGGLLDLALHPDYNDNKWIYFSYSALDTTSSERVGATGIMRARLQGDRLTDQQLLFTGSPATNRSHHWGCKLAFDGKGHLFFGVGERGQHFDFPQALDNTNGKIHRINDDGTIPADNPFVEIPAAIASIYSYGHRNPQGNVVHPVTGELWESEHGPMGGDEINLIRPGLNYGWPEVSYGINYDGTILTEDSVREGMEQPKYQWTPSMAPCGMAFVTGDRFERWRNNLLVGSLRFDYVERVVLEGERVVHTEKLAEGIGRVRNVVMGPDGLVYIGLEEPGMIVRLVPVEQK
ncbi:PQQ-dependent sugar dehydrogenase [Dysgonomonadaceae bacterium zrk40]|nr:PQQ-dependent sugar dehydrogenase [Dysgonomonadaceae bacterium zrk40]